jgi:hypothetical protein
VVPVAYACLDTAYLQTAPNPEMRAEFEHLFKVASLVWLSLTCIARL